MTWLLLTTGFAGALTLIYLGRLAARALGRAAETTSHFGPGPACADLVVRAIARARREVLVLARSLASPPEAQALIDAKLRGVHVEVLLAAASERDPQSDLHFLLEQGLVPLLGADPDHEKLILIDGRTLLLGRFDAPVGGESDTDGALLVLRSHLAVGAAYRQHFARLKERARPARAPATSRSDPEPAPISILPAVATPAA